jgi:hypothetical protein
MGPPPKYLITRKLVRRFFNRYTANTAADQDETPKMQKLWDLYDRYGLDSPVPEAYEAVYDREYEARASFYKRIQDMRLRQGVMMNLPKPAFKFLVRGRFKKISYRRPPSIFDGVK